MKNMSGFAGLSFMLVFVVYGVCREKNGGLGMLSIHINEDAPANFFCTAVAPRMTTLAHSLTPTHAISIVPPRWLYALPGSKIDMVAILF